MAASTINVFVGAETGLLKGVDTSTRKWSNLNQLEAVSRQHEITAMCWGDSLNEICVGSRNRMISIFNRSLLEFTGSCHLPGGEGIFRGLAKADGRFVTAVESGLVTVWDEDAQETEVTIDTEGNLWKMRQHDNKPNVIATGGKENDLKLWDLQRSETPIFTAKNVKNDFLNLRVPVWVTDMAFLPDSDKVVTVTGHHQMRVYDPSLPQRRPVIDVEFDEYPITAMGLRQGYNQVVVGNTHGKMALMDLRTGKMVQCYKGFAGSIRSLACHSSAPVVASCGLDRILRIHDLNSRALLDKFYMKSRLNCLLLTNEWGSQDDDQEAVRIDGVEEGEENEDEGKDELWDQLEEVKDKTGTGRKEVSKKRSIDRNAESLDEIKSGKKSKQKSQKSKKMKKS